MYPFWVGHSGWVYRLISFPLHHSRKSSEMNSGSLSYLIFFSLPFSQITFSNVFITLLVGKDIETSWDTATLSLSSIMFSTRNFLLHSRTSPSKSREHVVLGCRPYCFFLFSVISPFLIIVIRTVDLHQLARPSDTQFVFLYNLYCYLFLYLGVKCNRACRGGFCHGAAISFFPLFRFY